MQTLRRHLITASAVMFMFAVTGVATAATIVRNDSSPPHTNPAQKFFAACPARDRHGVASSNTTGSGTALVPAGARQVLLCHYSGFSTGSTAFGPGSFRLIAHHLVSAHATVASLASYLDALKPVHGAQACPNDNGSVIIAFFRYGSTSPKSNDPGGDTSKGHLNREVSGSFARHLKSLAATHH